MTPKTKSEETAREKTGNRPAKEWVPEAIKNGFMSNGTAISLLCNEADDLRAKLAEVEKWDYERPETPKAVPYAVISDNGARFIVDDGTREHAFQCVIAYKELPPFPQVEFQEKAFQDSYGNWVGVYNARPYCASALLEKKGTKE